MLLTATYAKLFTTVNPINGELADADSTPTVAVFRNGVSDDMNLDMTVASTGSTGEYKITSANSFFDNDFANGDIVDVVISATVDSVTGKMVHSFTIDGSYATSANLTSAVTSIKGTDNDTLKTLSDQIDGVAPAGEIETVLNAAGLATETNATANKTALQQILEADEVLVQDSGGWYVSTRIKNTSTELFRKLLKDENGAAITSTDNTVGQRIHSATP